MVCVDCFSKFVILGALPDRQSKTLAEWFDREVIKRRGVLVLVYSDNGSEWAKDFLELLHSYFVNVRKIKPGHSRANGMAERMV